LPITSIVILIRWLCTLILYIWITYSGWDHIHYVCSYGGPFMVPESVLRRYNPDIRGDAVSRCRQKSL